MSWTEVATGVNSCVKAVVISQIIILATKFWWLETSLMTFCPALTTKTDGIAWIGANKKQKQLICELPWKIIYKSLAADRSNVEKNVTFS